MQCLKLGQVRRIMLNKAHKPQNEMSEHINTVGLLAWWRKIHKCFAHWWAGASEASEARVLGLEAADFWLSLRLLLTTLLCLWVWEELLSKYKMKSPKGCGRRSLLITKFSPMCEILTHEPNTLRTTSFQVYWTSSGLPPKKLNTSVNPWLPPWWTPLNFF